MNLVDYFAAFHFLRPVWLLAFVPMLLLLWGLRKLKSRQINITDVISPVMYEFLTQGAMQQKSSKKTSVAPLWFSLSLLILALAGPTVKQIPQPTYQVQVGTVLLMNMSLSMRATDLKPNRLARARFKAIDFINANTGGEIGLVAYAGDAFVISPITADGKNLAALIPSLQPEIMPEYGSDPILGLAVAAELLTQAGYQSGNIVWFTDGVDYGQVPELTSALRKLPFTVSIMAIGTESGAPIKQLNGQLLKDNSGAIVIPKVNPEPLRTLSAIGGGTFTFIEPSDVDIERLVSALADDASSVNEDTTLQNDKWYELGPYLLLPIMLIILWYCRTGYLFTFAFISATGPLLATIMLSALLTGSLYSTESHAQISSPSNGTNQNPVLPNLGLPNAQNGALSQSELGLPPPNVTQTLNVTNPLSFLPRALQNKQQQALNAYKEKDFSTAQQLFSDPQWLGNTLYQQGDYAGALEQFKKDTSPQGWFNQGNALAATQQYEAALNAYDKALEGQPDFIEAQESKEALELFLEQQPPTEQNQQQNQDENAESDSNNSEESSENNDSSDSQQDSSEQNPSEQQNNSQNANKDNSNDAASNSESHSEQQDAPPQEAANNAPEEGESEEQKAEKSAEEQSEDTADNNAEAQPDERENSEQDESAMAAQPAELTPEELEQQQKMQSLMNKIPDDPGYLLKRKMQLEYQKRQRQRMPKNSKKDW